MDTSGLYSGASERAGNTSPSLPLELFWKLLGLVLQDLDLVLHVALLKEELIVRIVVMCLFSLHLPDVLATLSAQKATSTTAFGRQKIGRIDSATTAAPSNLHRPELGPGWDGQGTRHDGGLGGNQRLENRPRYHASS